MTDIITIHYEDVVAALQHYADERPDYVYERPVDKKGNIESCLYVKDGKPSCLIGHVLIERFHMPRTLITEGTAAFAVIDETDQWVGDDGNTYRWTDDPAEKQHIGDLAGSAQSSQDEGDPWRVAVAHAIDLYGAVYPSRDGV